MPQRRTGLKRYSLVLPEELFNEVKQVADDQHTTIMEVLRKYIRLGLVVSKIQKAPDTALLIREGKEERQIILI